MGSETQEIRTAEKIVMSDEPKKEISNFLTWEGETQSGGRVRVSINADDLKDMGVYLTFWNGAIWSQLSLSGDAMQELTMLYMRSLRYRTAKEDERSGAKNETSKWIVEQADKALKAKRSTKKKARKSK